MAASVTSPADAVNLALRRIGYQLRVGHLYDGSKAANNALDIYAQTRDALLRDGDWGFAQATTAAVASGQAAPTPWAVSYQYPADCLRVRNLIAAAFDANDPLPVLWEIATDAVAGTVILTNEANAKLVYTRQVTNPALWDPLFVETFADELAKGLAPVLASLEAEKVPAEALKGSMPTAERTVG
jgi:hypothetical protein